MGKQVNTERKLKTWVKSENNNNDNSNNKTKIAEEKRMTVYQRGMLCFQLTAFYFNRQLQEIQSKANSPGIGIGSLTGEKRDTWHEVGKLGWI